MHDDFDASRYQGSDSTTVHSFSIGGEQFEYIARAPADLIAAYFDSGNAGSPTRNADVLAASDDLIVEMLRPGYPDVWKRVRELRGPEALTIRDVQAVADRMLEVMTGRPTESSSGSGATRAQSGTSSTVDSPSPAVS